MSATDSAAHGAPSPAGSDTSTSFVSAPGGDGAVAVMICEECEAEPATLKCEDCGLLYCVGCDKRRHRKGNLVFHQRKPMIMTNSQQHHRPVHPSQWTQANVMDWLGDHELDVFLPEASLHCIDGAFLLSLEMESFVESQSAASRGHKKKLLREIQKLKSDLPGATTTSLTTSSPDPRSFSSSFLASPERAFPSPSSSASGFAAVAAPIASERNSLRRMGVNLRVNIDAQRAPAPEKHFSPVAALRSRATHSQDSELKGRVVRRTSSKKLYADLVLDENASTPIVNVNKSVERRHTPIMMMPLEIDLSSPPSGGATGGGGGATGTPALEMYEKVLPVMDMRPPARDLKSIRQALGGLDLDMMNPRKDHRPVEASFDFSAEGRLQTQGFEINTNGIANVPFPNQDSAQKTVTHPHGAREYLVILNELGQGAGGKVYKALYVPTFKLVAVKVIRVFDQKKRHQMVRELRSLYANWAPLDDTSTSGSSGSTTGAACDELVVFYDAYTNPELGSVSIVLEYMDGGSLDDYLHKSKRSCSERELANIAYCGLKGLAFLHGHHQLHRDIKLSNMLINKDGLVKISDFGISRDLESTLAKATTFTGTLLYMAPERISGGMYSYPSDIWSFGLALMACAIGKLPVPTKEGYWGVVHAVQEQPSPKLADYGDHFSPELCDFVDLCLRKNPLTRPPASQLLKHAFLTQNYQPGVRQSLDTSTTNQEEPTTAKAMEELERIATQVKTWWLNRAASSSSPPSTTTTKVDESFLHRTSYHDKTCSLAKQLQLPVEIVAAKFQFMNH